MTATEKRKDKGPPGETPGVDAEAAEQLADEAQPAPPPGPPEFVRFLAAVQGVVSVQRGDVAAHPVPDALEHAAHEAITEAEYRKDCRYGLRNAQVEQAVWREKNPGRARSVGREG